MENIIEEKKSKIRVSQDHWRVILEFAELHPEIITNKFSTHLQGKKNNKTLWEQLTLKLNSLGQGQRSTEEWKKTLADWKSKTKLKASKILKYSQGTDGGPANPIVLTTLEEKLLSLMGKCATFGDNSASEKGIKRKLCDTEQSARISLELDICSNTEASTEVNSQTYVQDEVIIDHEYFYGVDIEPSYQKESGGSNQSPVTIPQNENICNKKVREKGKKYITDANLTANDMHKDVMAILSSIDVNIASIANSFNELVQYLQRQ